MCCNNSTMMIAVENSTLLPLLLHAEHIHSVQLRKVYGNHTEIPEIASWLVPPVQATQEVLSQVPETTPFEFNSAVEAARDAFPMWSAKPLPERTRIMFNLLNLIRQYKVLRRNSAHLVTRLDIWETCCNSMILQNISCCREVLELRLVMHS